MNSNSSIPFLDLVTPHVELEAELTDVFRQVLHTAGFIGGPMVEKFEKAFATFCEAKHSVAISSGTDALRFALMACGVRQATLLSPRPTHLLRLRKQSHKREPCLSSWTLMSAPTTWTRPRCKSIWTRSAGVILSAVSLAVGVGAP